MVLDYLASRMTTPDGDAGDDAGMDGRGEDTSGIMAMKARLLMLQGDIERGSGMSQAKLFAVSSALHFSAASLSFLRTLPLSLALRVLAIVYRRAGQGRERSCAWCCR